MAFMLGRARIMDSLLDIWDFDAFRVRAMPFVEEVFASWINAHNDSSISIGGLRQEDDHTQYAVFNLFGDSRPGGVNIYRGTREGCEAVIGIFIWWGCTYA